MNENDSILLIDDDGIDREAIARAFKHSAIKNPLFTAFDGVDALEKLRGENGQEQLSPLPKIILLDINMPRMNGLEFLKALNEDQDLNTITVFILTSSDSRDDMEAASEFDVAGYLVKSVNVPQLMDVITDLNNIQ